jgi:hypothetical protein
MSFKVRKSKLYWNFENHQNVFFEECQTRECWHSKLSSSWFTISLHKQGKVQF